MINAACAFAYFWQKNARSSRQDRACDRRWICANRTTNGIAIHYATDYCDLANDGALCESARASSNSSLTRARESAGEVSPLPRSARDDSRIRFRPVRDDAQWRGECRRACTRDGVASPEKKRASPFRAALRVSAAGSFIAGAPRTRTLRRFTPASERTRRAGVAPSVPLLLVHSVPRRRDARYIAAKERGETGRGNRESSRRAFFYGGGARNDARSRWQAAMIYRRTDEKNRKRERERESEPAGTRARFMGSEFSAGVFLPRRRTPLHSVSPWMRGTGAE